MTCFSLIYKFPSVLDVSASAGTAPTCVMAARRSFSQIVTIFPGGLSRREG